MNQAHRYVCLSPDKRKELERLLLDITNLELRGTKELLDRGYFFEKI